MQVASDTSPFKLGQVSPQIDPNPFTNTSLFTQELDLATATVTIKSSGVTVSVWVDAVTGNIAAEVQTTSPVRFAVHVDSVRPAQHFNFSSPFMFCSAGSTVIMPPDVVLAATPPPFPAHTAIVYHRNQDLGVFRSTLETQGLGELAGQLPDPLVNRTFGVAVAGTTDNEPLVKVSPSLLAFPTAVTSALVTVSSVVSQTSTVEQWYSLLYQQTTKGVSRRAHEDWWRSFWNRSHVHVSANSTAAVKSDSKLSTQLNTLSQKYALTRYVQVPGRGKAPLLRCLTPRCAAGHPGKGVSSDQI